MGLAGLLSHRGVTVFRGEAELRDVHDVHVAPAGGEAQVMYSLVPANDGGIALGQAFYLNEE